MNPEKEFIRVSWYDDYDCPHESEVYFVDSVRDRFLVADENDDFHWVPTKECTLLNGGGKHES